MRGFFSACAALLLDQEVIALLTRDPLRRLAAARPCAAAVRIAILRRHSGTGTGTRFCTLGATAARQFLERDPVISHFLLDLVKHFRIFTRLRFFNLSFEILALSEEFLV